MNQLASERTELTLRGVVLGCLITLLFTAANVYFGLKAGLTFATSIPAAVISMALLRYAKGVTMQENNIVQTVASAAGAISSIIFVLPGLVMIGWWTGFPYWTSLIICASGGVLGVMYSIPLRRALVTESDLPYPEGVACAEVLKVGDQGEGAAAENRAGLMAIVWGAIASAALQLVVATQVFASDVLSYFRLGKDSNSVTGVDFSLSFALVAVGHLVGLWVGIAMGVGVLIAWAVAVPYLTSLHPLPAGADVAAVAVTTWAKQVRFVGAGAIAVAAVWTLIKLVGPVARGLRSAIAASRVRRAGQGSTLALTEQDMPIGWMAIVTLICMLPIGWMLANFANQSGLGSQTAILVVGGVVFIALMSFFVAAVCGYMAGLVGSSNSPLSGVGIIVVIMASLLLVLAVKPLLPDSAGPALVAFALFVTAVVIAGAVVANDNLQDLKTGQLVDATPWRQQVALVIGVIAGAVVIPPVLDLLQKAYGFAGAPGADPAHALAAPQAALISALARGVLQGNLDWHLLGTGAALGVVLIMIDGWLKRGRKPGQHAVQLPPLAVGLGIYLPAATTLTVVIGALIGWFWDRRADKTARPEAAKQLGVLLASGMIVGEGLLGVALAALNVFSGKDAPLSLVGAGFGDWAMGLGGIGFVLATGGLYKWLAKLSDGVTNGAAR
ncbi:MAG TPA: oligopeptide transporter, OPT family [Burkholderiaceae bacterium]